MRKNKLLSYMLAIYIVTAILISYLPAGANISQGIGVALAFLFLIEFLVERRRLLLPRELVLFSVFFVYTLIGGCLACNYGTFWASEFTLFQLLVLSIISCNILANRLAIILAMKSFVAAAAIAGILSFVGINFSSSSRLASTLGNPNMYGLVLVFSIAIAMYLFIQSPRKWEKFFYLLFIPFSTYQIILTGSRKAIIGFLGLAVIFFVLCAWRRFRYQPGRGLVVVLILAGVLIGFGYILSHSGYYKRVEYLREVLVTRDIEAGGGSIKERAEFYIAAYRAWKDHPLFGVGTNQFRFYTNKYVAGLRNTYAHSNFMEIAADFGLIGFVLYYSIYVAVFLRFYRFKKNNLSDKDRLSMYALLALVIVFVVLEVAWVTYIEKVTWIMLTIVIAQTLDMHKKYREGRSYEA